MRGKGDLRASRRGPRRAHGTLLRRGSAARPFVAAPPGAGTSHPFRRMRPSPLRRVTTVIAVVVIAGLVIALAKEYAHTYTLARQAAHLEQHRQDLVEQNTHLREEIRRLQTDDRYIERLARQQLGLVRPGEIELLIVSPGGTSPRGTPEPAQSGPKENTAAPSTTPGGGNVTTPARPGPDGGTGSPAPRAWPWSWSDRLHGTMKRLFGWLHR